MPLRPDFHDIAEVFIYSNLSVMINTIASPLTARAAVASTSSVTTANTPPNPAVNASRIETAAAALLANVVNTRTTVIVPQKTVDSSTLSALQAVTLNNFTNLGLKSDIADITRVFFASLPPIKPAVTPTVPLTPTQPTQPLRALNQTPAHTAVTG